MAETNKTQNFWMTLPGVLTAVAALLTAVTGLIVAVHPHAHGEGKDAPVTAVQSNAQATTPSHIQPSGSAQASSQQTKQGVLITGADGSTTRVLLRGFRNSMTDDALGLQSGQSIPFEKIQRVEFLRRVNYERDVAVTLVDGQILNGSIPSGQQFLGYTDVGPFSISASDVKTITFEK